MQQAVVYIRAAFVATTRAEMTALREMESRQEERGLLLRRKRIVVVRVRVEVARSRQRSSVLQFLRHWVQMNLCDACGLSSSGSVTEE